MKYSFTLNDNEAQAVFSYNLYEDELADKGKSALRKYLDFSTHVLSTITTARRRSLRDSGKVSTTDNEYLTLNAAFEESMDRFNDLRGHPHSATPGSVPRWSTPRFNVWDPVKKSGRTESPVVQELSEVQRDWAALRASDAITSFPERWGRVPVTALDGIATV